MTTTSPLFVCVRLPRENASSKAIVAAGREDGGENDGDVSSTASESGGSSVKRAAGAESTSSRRGRKKRKPTYAARREEMGKLSQEATQLEFRVDELSARAGKPSRGALQAVARTQHESRAMHEAWRTQTLALCGIQSVVGSFLREQPAYPLHLYVRLGKDLEERQRVLESVWEAKIDLGHRYLEERFRDVDDREPFCELQSWTTAQGEICFRRADILVFEGVQSVKQVFDALLFFFSNMEMSISEMLGQLTLRDEIDSGDSRIVSHRITSTTDHGVTMEMNAVGFSEYVNIDGEESALLVTDSVDEDELYPYCPSERVRKNISGAIGLRSFRRPRDQDDAAAADHDADVLVVSMKRCVYLSFERPEFPITRAAREDLRTNIAIWGDVMGKTMREYLGVDT